MPCSSPPTGIGDDSCSVHSTPCHGSRYFSSSPHPSSTIDRDLSTQQLPTNCIIHMTSTFEWFAEHERSSTALHLFGSSRLHRLRRFNAGLLYSCWCSLHPSHHRTSLSIESITWPVPASMRPDARLPRQSDVLSASKAAGLFAPPVSALSISLTTGVADNAKPCCRRVSLPQATNAVGVCTCT